MEEQSKVKEPVFSVSLGAIGEFEYAPAGSSLEEGLSIQLNSGDVIIFGGPARQLMHRVTKIFPLNTCPRELNMRNLKGRFNFGYYNNNPL